MKTLVYLTGVLSNCRMFCLRLTNPRLFYELREVPEATYTLGYTFGDMLRDVPDKISLSILDEEFIMGEVVAIFIPYFYCFKFLV